MRYDADVVRDGWNRPDDESTESLSQVEQDEKRRRETLNEEDDANDDAED